MNIKQGDIINEYSLRIYQDRKVEKEKDLHEVVAVKEHIKRGQVIAITDDYQGIEVIQTVYDKDGMSIPLIKLWFGKITGIVNR